jgi:hypothetical protein
VDVTRLLVEWDNVKAVSKALQLSNAASLATHAGHEQIVRLL